MVLLSQGICDAVQQVTRRSKVVIPVGLRCLVIRTIILATQMDNMFTLCRPYQG
jgi:hypothetical protein